MAWDRYNFVAVQQFEGDYIEYTVLPTLNGGVLSMEGKLKNGANLEHGDHFRVTISYHSPPRQLTQGQIARVYGSCLGRKVAFLSYTVAQEQRRALGDPCLSPYDVSPDAPAPTSGIRCARICGRRPVARYEALPRSPCP